MTVSDQAAVLAAQAAQQTATATWWLFGATAVVAVFTIAIAGIGFYAARSALDTYRLEAEPVLVITVVKDTTQEIFPRYVVTGNPSLAEGLKLRLWQPADDPALQQGATAVPYGGGSRRPSMILEIVNVGRSPAIGVELGLDLRVGITIKPGEEVDGFVEEPAYPGVESALPMRSGVQKGTGMITIPATAPQSKVQVRVENCTGLSPTFTFLPFGHQVRWNMKSRRVDRIAVISPIETFRFPP